MSDVEYYKNLMKAGDTTDYTGGEFLGEQAQSHRKTSTKKKWGSQVERSGVQPDDWLGASPGKARKSYVIKEKKVVVPHVDSEEEEKVKDEPVKPIVVTPAVVSPTKEETKSEEKTEEPVDPEIAKYRAMMHRDEGNDYATNEFLGDQAQSHRKSTTKKKWGSQVDRSGTQPDDWLGASPGKARKSYVVKEKKSAPAVVDDDKPTQTTTPAPAPKPEEKKEEPVDPEIAKYKAMMHRDEGNDYATNEFLGDQAAAHRTKTTKKKWGSQVDRSGTQPDDWLGSSPGKARKSYVIKEKKSTPAPEVHHSDDEKEEPKKEEEPEKEEESTPAPKPAEKKEEPVDPEIAKYKAMMHRDEGNDYATNEFLGDQAAAHRTKTTKKKWGSQVDRSGTQPDDWLGASPGKARKSYVVKEKKSAPAPEVHHSDDEKEEPKKEEEPTSAPKPTEKKEEPVDPEIAKYKAMMHRDEGNDYATNEFLGDQAAAHRTKTTKKKWGSQVDRSGTQPDDWLGASPGKARKSYVIKEKKSTPAPEVHEEKETATKEETFLQEQTNTAFSVKKEEEPAKKEEVDPEIAKYRAMMHRDEGNDYATNEFLGEQAQVHSKKPKKKSWGTKVERVNDDWLGSGGTTRKSYTVKGSSSASKPPFSPASPAAARASFSPVGSPGMASPKVAQGGFVSPVSQKERMAGRASFSAAMSSLSAPKVSSSPRTSLTHESPVSDKERMAGRKSFSAAFDMFKKNDTSVPAAFASAAHNSPTKRNFRVSKEAQAKDKEAHSHHEEEHHEPTVKEDQDSGLHEEHKAEFDEALQMLNKIFLRLDDREASWKQMDAVIKKIGKATKQGADIKAILSYSITSLQHIAGLLYNEDQSDTDDVVEKLIDLNMQL